MGGGQNFNWPVESRLVKTHQAEFPVSCRWAWCILSVRLAKDSSDNLWSRYVHVNTCVRCVCENALLLKLAFCLQKQSEFCSFWILPPPNSEDGLPFRLQLHSHQHFSFSIETFFFLLRHFLQLTLTKPTQDVQQSNDNQHQEQRTKPNERNSLGWPVLKSWHVSTDFLNTTPRQKKAMAKPDVICFPKRDFIHMSPQKVKSRSLLVPETRGNFSSTTNLNCIRGNWVTQPVRLDWRMKCRRVLILIWSGYSVTWQ